MAEEWKMGVHGHVYIVSASDFPAFLYRSMGYHMHILLCRPVRSAQLSSLQLLEEGLGEPYGLLIRDSEPIVSAVIRIVYLLTPPASSLRPAKIPKQHYLADTFFAPLLLNFSLSQPEQILEVVVVHCKYVFEVGKV